MANSETGTKRAGLPPLVSAGVMYCGDNLERRLSERGCAYGAS